MKKNNSRDFLRVLSEYKVKCSRCGHIVVMIKRKKMMCNWCGATIYKNKKEEFKDKIRKELRKNDR